MIDNWDVVLVFSLLIIVFILSIYIFCIFNSIKSVDQKIDQLHKQRVYFCDLCGSPTDDYLRRSPPIPSSICLKCKRTLSKEHKGMLFLARTGHPITDQAFQKCEYFDNNGEPEDDI